MDQAIVLDELGKIGASKQRMTMAQSRSGRRSMHVDTLLRKEQEGTLYKKTGDEHKIASLAKEAITRAVKEWRAAAGGGNQDYANQIAAASGNLGLKPRYLENVSGGGMEGAVDKMMGRAMGPETNTSGYLAQKIYKPDSPLSTGQDTSKLLAMKKQYTDTARSLSPEAREMVPAMYGHREIQGPGGQLRHVSQHELVEGAGSLRKDPNAVLQAQRVHDVVAKPMAERGMPLGDIARVHEGRLAGNTGNVVTSPAGPKVIDFLPGGKDSPVAVHQIGQHDIATPSGSGYTHNVGGVQIKDTAYNKSNVNQLRRDVFRPQANYQPPALAPDVVQEARRAQRRAMPVGGFRAAAPPPTPKASPFGLTEIRPTAVAKTQLAPAAEAATAVTKPLSQTLRTAGTKVLQAARPATTAVTNVVRNLHL